MSHQRTHDREPHRRTVKAAPKPGTTAAILLAALKASEKGLTTKECRAFVPGKSPSHVLVALRTLEERDLAWEAEVHGVRTWFPMTEGGRGNSS